eukprot:NODE_9470_length_640_cov_84.205029_g9204_i0.p2 GENE.NODE_9470_length_640_cov_84.205029_g9204_i0~~NODE_9470_length_640_cov_84.205029_g9204_i0.p2  ORF type:complete len:134 (-),score=36.12 NODE_9470_length_640_cov_84.205029_g9204_i0:152-553(-)
MTMHPRDLQGMFGEEKLRKMYDAKDMIANIDAEAEKQVVDEGTYKWQQNKEEVTVIIDFTEDTSSKQLNVDLKTARLTAGLKGATPIIEGELFQSIIVEDSTWVLENKRTLIITLVKGTPSQALSGWTSVLAK